jgi:flagellar basal-body rod modification protein FlgD
MSTVTDVGSLPPFDPTVGTDPSYRNGINLGQTAGVDPLANKNTFLNLLVAQLKNQDPLNPDDGTQFVTQLAQFTQLEQTLSMKQDLDGIKQDLDKNAPSGTPPAAKPAP